MKKPKKNKNIPKRTKHKKILKSLFKRQSKKPKAEDGGGPE